MDGAPRVDRRPLLRPAVPGHDTAYELAPLPDPGLAAAGDPHRDTMVGRDTGEGV